METIVVLIVIIAFAVLQFAFLGKKKFLGFLLPLICFVVSILAIFCSNIFGGVLDTDYTGNNYSVVVEQNGVESKHIFKDENSKDEFIETLDSSYKILEETNSTADSWLKMFGKLLLATNIPTLALLIIYINRRLRVLYTE